MPCLGNLSFIERRLQNDPDWTLDSSKLSTVLACILAGVEEILSTGALNERDHTELSPRYGECMKLLVKRCGEGGTADVLAHYLNRLVIHEEKFQTRKRIYGKMIALFLEVLGCRQYLQIFIPHQVSRYSPTMPGLVGFQILSHDRPEAKYWYIIDGTSRLGLRLKNNKDPVLLKELVHFLDLENISEISQLIDNIETYGHARGTVEEVDENATDEQISTDITPDLGTLDPDLWTTLDKTSVLVASNEAKPRTLGAKSTKTFFLVAFVGKRLPSWSYTDTDCSPPSRTLLCLCSLSFHRFRLMVSARYPAHWIEMACFLGAIEVTKVFFRVEALFLSGARVLFFYCELSVVPFLLNRWMVDKRIIEWSVQIKVLHNGITAR
jgi:hypothetical protein